MATIACTETFEDVETLMYSVIHKFYRRYGGEFDEWRSEGHRIFMRAYTTYNPEAKTSFHSWFHFLLVKLFTERIRRLAMQYARHRQEYMDFSNTPCRFRPGFDVDEFAEDLSDDARWVVELVVNSPFDIQLALADVPENRTNVKRAVKEFLTDLGWSRSRVLRAFAEITEVLTP